MSQPHFSPTNAQQTFEAIATQYERTIGQITRPVAAHLATLSQSHGLSTNAKILDNASGTGIMLDEILSLLSPSILPTISITATDAAPPMISILNQKANRDWIKSSNSEPTLGLQANNFHALPLSAEHLDTLPSTTFTHSFTNFGFQFFTDAPKAATDIYRTLQPNGYAYITSWANVGYLTAIADAAEEIRPGKGGLKLPWGDEWYQASHVENIMRGAGFKEVEMHTCDSAWPGKTKLDIAKSMCTFLTDGARRQGWTEEEAAKLPDAMERAFEKYPDEALYVAEDGVWKVHMVANVAVCRK